MLAILPTTNHHPIDRMRASSRFLGNACHTVNATVVMFDNGVTPSDDVSVLWAVVLVGVAVVLALSQRVLRRDTAYGMVIAWALYGVAVKQGIYATEGLMPDAPLLVTAATYAAQALAGLLAIWWLTDRVGDVMRKRPVA